MDLRSLIAKMDAIEQDAVLAEAETILERITSAEVMATKSITDQTQRRTALGKLAADNGYPGMFDPVDGEYILPDGTVSGMGPSEAEVKQLEQHGLVPSNAKTSSWLGLRGREQAAAASGSKTVQDRDTSVKRATDLIKKALTKTPAAAPNAPTGQGATQAKESYFDLSDMLLESFGYKEAVMLAESITVEEHRELKTIIKALQPVRNDENVAVVLEKFRAYNERRDEIIARINELIEAIKASKKPASTKESTQLDEATMPGWMKQLGSKGVWLLNIGTAVYDAWTQINALDKNLPKEKYRSAVAKIIGEVVAEFGLFAVGSIIGGMIGGLFGTAGGPVAFVTALAGAIAGGLMVQHKFQGDVNKLVDQIVDYVYPQGSDKPTTSNTTTPAPSTTTTPAPAQTSELPSDLPAADTTTSGGASLPSNTTQNTEVKLSNDDIKATIQQLQKELEAAGFSVGQHGVDGKFGPDTFGALRAYKEKNKLPSDADAIAKLLKVEQVKESIDINKLSESEKMAYLMNRLDELKIETPAWAERGLAKFGVKTAAKQAAEKLGSEVKLGGTVYELVPGTTKYRVQGGSSSIGAEELLAKGAKPVKPVAPIQGVPGGTTYTHTTPSGDATVYFKSAKDGQWYVKDPAAKGGWRKGSKQEQSGVEQAATKNPSGKPPANTSTPAPAPTTLPPNVPAVTSSRVAQLLKSKSFWAATAALGAMYYFFDGNGNIVNNNSQNNNANNTQNQTGGGALPTETPEQAELKRLLQQLIDGWPDDVETQNAIAAAGAVGVKMGGQGALPANDKSWAAQELEKQNAEMKKTFGY